MKTVFFFNNIFPSEKYPDEGTYAETISNVIKDTGYNVEYHVLRKTGHKWLDYSKYYMHLLIMVLPCKGEILYINHYSMLLPLIFRLLFINERVIFHWHGEELLRQGLLFRVIRFLIRKTFSKRDIHISPSFYYSKVIKSVLCVPESQIVVSPSGGVDLFSFNERILTDSCNIHLGFPAALNKHKGIDYLRMIVDNKMHLEKKIGKKVYIHVINYGEDSSSFINIINSTCRNDIIVSDKVSHSQMSDFYSKIHLTLFFSKRESLGLTVLESMACGVPVIARDNTSMPELIIPNVTGELVSNMPEYKEIEEKIIYVLSHISNYRTRDYVKQKYSRNIVVEQYREILNTFQ